MRFLGNVLATIVGIFVFIMLFFFGVLLLGALFGGDSDKVAIKENSVIELDLSKIQYDYAGKTNFKEFDYYQTPHNGLSDVINAINYAKTDDNIKGISILNTTSNLGIAQMKALRDALEDFKTSKKFIYAYSNVYSQGDYYLSSVANQMYINPVGELELKGLSAEVMYFKDLEDKTGVKMEVIRHGKYKSAVEPFLENKMSDANREQLTVLLNSIWNSIIKDISKSRNVPVEKLNEITNGLLARTPQMAKDQKIIDKVAYEDVYHDDIKKLLKVDADEDYESIKIEDYTENVATSTINLDASDKIAIVYAQGEIASGEGDVNVIGEGSMRRALKEAREDDDVKAIVLRVNSPGGSALTSDLIWRELELTKKVKPIVVSMGDYAASGGYYISCNANKIFAEENTITGSIGVFGMLPNLHQLANKIGLNAEQIKTHENAQGYTAFEPIDDKYKSFATESVEHIYTTFVSRVAAGRKMTTAQVDSIAQGRVWSGSEAIKIGLVDKIGGMDEAIKEAASLSKTKKYRTVNYPEYEKTMDDILANFGLAQSREAIIKEEIGTANYEVFKKLKTAINKKGVQARMTFEIKIN
jgi:protease-4